MDVKISVIIPVYNTGKYLKECLESVFSQNMEKIEVICVDDGSTDDSYDILSGYASSCHPVKILKQTNQGLSCSRNNGVKKANGEYLYFLDSDDMLADGALPQMYEQAKKYDLDVLYIDGKTFFDSPDLENFFGGYKSSYARRKSFGLYERGWQLFRDMIRADGYCVQTSLQMIKREFYQKYGLSFYPGILYEDNLFNLKCMLSAGRVMHVNEQFFLRRIRGNSIMTSNVGLRNLWSAAVVCREMASLASHYPEDFSGPIKKEIETVLYRARNQVSSIYHKMDYHEKCALEEMNVSDKFQICTILEAEKHRSESYPVPFYLFPRGCRIVLYGAGKIGKSYFSQMAESDYLKVVEWIDKRAEIISKEGFPVSSLHRIVNAEYDFVFIAIADRQMADEARTTLISLGVKEECIIYEKSAYVISPEEQMENLFYRLSLLGELLNRKKARLWFFMTPEHGNMGDYAICKAQRRYIKDNFSEYDCIEVPTAGWEMCRDVCVKGLQEDDILFFSGGGFIGDIWESGSILKEIVKTFPYNKKYILPNTFSYFDNCGDSMREDALFYASQFNLCMLFRDKASYKLALKRGYRKKEQLGYFPDMALDLDYPGEMTGKRAGVMLCFRNDCEKIIENTFIERLKEMLDTLGIHYEMNDTHLHRPVKRFVADHALDDKLKEFQRVKLVLTDRLHGMIFAAITGTPCIALDNSTGKVKGVYEWIHNLKYIRLVTPSQCNSELLKEMLDIRACKYENAGIKRRMREMTEYIRNDLHKEENI